MLIGIDPLLSPELLMILRAMGHGDEIAIVDANFPAKSNAKRLVRLDGADASQALAAILSVLPLDSFVKAPANGMQVVGKPKEIPPAVADFQTLVDRLGRHSRPRSRRSSASPSTSAPRPASPSSPPATGGSTPTSSSPRA